MATSEIRIVPVEPDHRAAWDELYAGYAAFYRVDQTPEMRARVWSWLMTGEGGLGGFVALGAEGTPVGLAHYRPFLRPLSASTGGYLDDLFVAPSARGSGAAEALIAAVAEVGRTRGWSLIRWHTAEENARARKVYDRVARKTHWVIYDLAP